MKKLIGISLMLSIVLSVFSCKKDKPAENTTPKDNYSSVADFFQKNRTPLHKYSINATTGGSFTTSKGTIVTIPANSFITQNSTIATGNIDIYFKDIYSKSEMLLNDISTNMPNGGPIKSAGMFCIKAMQNGQEIFMLWGKKITIEQPFNGLPVDTAMIPMVLLSGDSVPINFAGGWIPAAWDTSSAMDSLLWTASSYIFSMYNFSVSSDSGSWCNTDNPTFFSTYPQTTLTINPTDIYSTYHMEVFLVFSDVNSMVHVYSNWNGTSFPYLYAPLGLQCTIVSVGVKNGTLYSCFKPITITNNLTVDFTLSETTTDEFETELEALND